RALHNPKAVNDPPKDPSTSPIDPAAHYFYFFDEDPQVAKFVDDIFRNVAGCADGDSCRSAVLQCSGPGDPAAPNLMACNKGIYGFTFESPDSNHNVVNMCDEGLDLPPAPAPCTTAGGADSPGYALLYEMVQAANISVFDSEFLLSKTVFPTIFPISAPDAPLKEIGWGEAGTGLKGDSLANAQNYAAFAQWSWDLGFGGEQWDGNTCVDKFTETVVQPQELRPIGRNLRETGELPG
ncbi:MAG: hypothetical protein Q9183_006308, partial [Haloplaca sp. 2 TL-2023]